jgi:uncharacterized protein YndB with AHSA1/START domain
MDKPDLVYLIFIETSADRLWALLTSGEESPRWFFGNRIEIGDAPGGPYRVLRPDGVAVVDGQLLVVEPPQRLRVRWDMPGDPLGPGRANEIEYRIEPAAPGVVRLSVLEYHHTPVPEDWQRAGREGWSLILSSLKTILETGRPMPPVTPSHPEEQP